MKLSEAINGFLIDCLAGSYAERTVQLHRINLCLLMEYLGDIEIEDITTHDLNSFMVYLRKEYKPRRLHESDKPLSEATRDNYWKAIRRLFSWASRELEISNPAATLQRPRYKPDNVVPFSRDEVKQLLEAAEYTVEIKAPGKRPHKRRKVKALRNKTLILFLLDTGLRVGEVCRVERDHLNLEEGEVIVIAYGSGRKTKPRVVMLGRQTRLALWEYLAKTPDDISLFGMTPTGIRTLLWTLGKQAGVHPCNPHRFRHTFALEYLRNEGDIFTLQRLLGHSSLEMVKRYLNILRSDLKTAHRKASPVDTWRLRRK